MKEKEKEPLFSIEYFGGRVLGCIEADLCKYVFILQYFESSRKCVITLMHRSKPTHFRKDRAENEPATFGSK